MLYRPPRHRRYADARVRRRVVLSMVATNKPRITAPTMGAAIRCTGEGAGGGLDRRWRQRQHAIARSSAPRGARPRRSPHLVGDMRTMSAAKAIERGEVPRKSAVCSSVSFRRVSDAIDAAVDRPSPGDGRDRRIITADPTSEIPQARGSHGNPRFLQSPDVLWRDSRWLRDRRRDRSGSARRLT